MRIRNQWVVAAAVIAVAITTASAQNTVFNDTFGSGSTVNSATPAAPTASSTDYEVASTKNTTDTIAANDLHFAIAQGTTSGSAEIQALFTSSAVTIQNLGEYIEVAITYINNGTDGIVQNNSSGEYGIGLYNSGGSAPVSGGALSQVGLNGNSGSTLSTGGASLWTGFVSLDNVGGCAPINVRAQQNNGGTTSANQELLMNGAFTGAYNNPKSNPLGTKTFSAIGNQVIGGQYTDVEILQVNNSGLLISNLWYAGAFNGGTPTGTVEVVTGTIDTSLSAATVDSLAFGFYAKGGNSGVTPIVDVGQVQVIDYLVPEPSTVMLLGAGLAMLVGLVSRRRRS